MCQLNLPLPEICLFVIVHHIQTRNFACAFPAKFWATRHPISLQGPMPFRKTIQCSWICCSNIMEKNITRWPNSKIRKCHHKLDLKIQSLQFGSALWHMHRHLTFSNKNPLIHLLPWILISLKWTPSVLISGPLCNHATAISAKPLKCELTKLYSKLWSR